MITSPYENSVRKTRRGDRVTDENGSSGSQRVRSAFKPNEISSRKRDGQHWIMWFVYIIFSKTRNKTYVGCASDVNRRLANHNAGRVKSTRFGVPWHVVYTEQLESYSLARKKEKYYKSSAGRRKLRVILNHNTT